MNRIATSEDGAHYTFCRLCEAQCGIIADVEKGKIVKIRPDKDHPVSRGHLCVKASGMLKVTYDRDRVLTPMKRTGKPGQFEAVSWSEALEDIAKRITDITETHGSQSLSSYIGNPASFSTLHGLYGPNFTKAFGPRKMFNSTQVDVGARVLASKQVYGNFCLPFPDLPECHFLMILGGNPMVSKMSLITVPRHLQQLDDIAERGAVIVVDPRNTETARRYTHQPIHPDGDVWLLAGMLKVLIEERLVKSELLAERVNGWDKLSSVLETVHLSRASQNSGIEPERIVALAHQFVNADRAACYGRCGTNRGRFSTLTNILIDSLNIATGNFGVAGGAIIGSSPFLPDVDMKGQTGAPHGSKRSRFGNLPVLAGAHPAGTLADEILVPGEGQIKALILDSGNPVLSLPDSEKMMRALDNLSLFVVLDLYMNESAKYADYILPTPTFYERSDITEYWSSNSPEPWLQYSEPVIHPMGEARHEYDVYSSILELCGKEDPNGLLLNTPIEPQANRSPHISAVDMALRSGPFGDGFGANPDGLSIDRLRDEYPHGKRLQDRAPAEKSWNKIAHLDGKAHLWDELIEQEFTRLLNSNDHVSDGTLKLFGRRILHGMNSWMHNDEKVLRNSHVSLLIHPDDAKNRHIEDGELVELRSETGFVHVKIEITPHVIPGSVNYPHGFGHDGGWQKANKMAAANINLLASSEPDDFEQVSGNCRLDGIPVEVSAIVSA
jgi:formate dehydrogenase